MSNENLRGLYAAALDKIKILEDTARTSAMEASGSARGSEARIHRSQQFSLEVSW